MSFKFQKNNQFFCLVLCFGLSVVNLFMHPACADFFGGAKFGMDSTGNELALVSMEHPRSFVSITGGPTLLIGYSTVHTSNFCVVTQWLINHPKFQKNPIYISGDSYSGIIIPIVVQEIYIQWYVNHDFSIWLRKGEYFHELYKNTI